MKCINHPEIDAVGICVKCGIGLCVECTKEIGSKFYCEVCTDVYVQPQPDKIYIDNSASSSEVRAPQRPAVNFTKAAKDKTAGNILTGIGTVGSIISLILLFKGFSMTGEEGVVFVFTLTIPALLISSVVAIIGIGSRFTKSTAALIYSIIGLLYNIFGFGLPGGLWSILAIAFGAMSLSESKQRLSRNSYKASIASLLLGIIGIVVLILSYCFNWFSL